MREKKEKQKIKFNLKGIKLGSLIEYLKSHRLVAILIAVALVAVIVLILMMTVFGGNQASTEIKTDGEDAVNKKTNISDLSIFIPENAYPYPKSYIIEKLPRDLEYEKYKNTGRYTGDIYELVPGDGRQDLALEPMTFQYIFPEEYYFGSEYNNAELVYIRNRENPVARIFSGGELVKNKNGRLVLEVKAFHGSLIGMRINNPDKTEWGLKKTIEKEETLKPHMLIIPGIDSNFLGFLPNTITNSNPQGNNFWEVTFPDRTIWSYNYPLTQTRSEEYMQSMKAFFAENSRTSYVMYEAHKLAEELKNTSKTFDVIAHGIGGVIARYAIEKYGVDNIRKLVLISAPNAGTNIVNTTFLNMLYGKNPEVISDIYSTDSETIRFVESNNLSYLEKVNSFYSDILPGSQILQELENSIRDDIEYAFIAGSYPGFDTDLEGTQLAKFYPENTPDKGDGIVSVYSGLYPSIENGGEEKENLFSLILPYSFFDIFVQNESLKYIYNFLESGIEQVVVPEFQDDTFKEWQYQYDTNMSTYTSDVEWPFSTSTVLNNESTETTQSTPTEANITTPFSDWKNTNDDYNVDNSETITDNSTKNTLSDNGDKTVIPKDNNSVSDHPADSTDDNNVDNTDSNGTGSDVATSTVVTTKNGTGNEIKVFIPDSKKWRFPGFPLIDGESTEIIRYDYLRNYIPSGISPYGLRVAGEDLYVLAEEGLAYMKGQNDFEIISDDQITSTYLLNSSLYTTDNGMLKSYKEGKLNSKDYLMNETDIISMAVNDSGRYLLSRYRGLILETPKSSFEIQGNYGKLILFGVYPYAICDTGIFLFNGKEIVEISRPFNEYGSFLDGVVKDDTLFVLSSDYYLSAISLDGKKHVDMPLATAGGFKILKNENHIIVCGRNKLVVYNFDSANPSGSYFNLEEGEVLIDAVYSGGKILMLIRNNDRVYIEKVTIIT